MKDFKGTPGQWYIQKFPDGSMFWVKSDHNPVVHYGTDILAEDFGDHNGYPEAQRMADAQLIANAPQLLHLAMMVANDPDSPFQGRANVLLNQILE